MVQSLTTLLLALGIQPTAALSVQRGSGLQHSGPYFWPTARGNVGEYSVSSYSGPENLTTSLSWSWHHPTDRHFIITLATLIDDEYNVYLAAWDKIRKFSQGGRHLWDYTPSAPIPSAPSLWDGALYGDSVDGHVWAVSMQTGKEIWKRKVSDRIGSDSHCMGVYNGVLVIPSDFDASCCGDFPYEHNIGSMRVRALSAATGEQLWEFSPDAGVWNFFPAFSDEGVVGFQDHEGKAYAVRLADGELVWKQGGVTGTFTDGSAIIGPNGVLYAVGLQAQSMEWMPGTVTAYRLQDGLQLWQRTVHSPPNIFPAVGRLGSGPGLSVVQAVGLHCQDTQNDMYAFDADTGEQQWFWRGPKNPNPYCRGDSDGYRARYFSSTSREACFPTTWSAPTIDSNGRVFIGDQDGKFYAVKDLNGDGVITWKTEVSSFDCEAAFPGPGSAHAPGMTAVASCDGLFVFKS